MSSKEGERAMRQCAEALRGSLVESAASSW